MSDTVIDENLETEVVIPVDEVQVTPANDNVDIEEIVTKVREEEKSKLYGRIENLKEDRDKLKGEIDDLNKKLTDAIDKLGTKDTEKSTETKELVELINGLRIQITDLETARVTDKEEAEKREVQLRLDTYKQTKIGEAKGKIIPELVIGTTEAEIDVSVAKATQRYSQIVKDATKTNKQTVKEIEDEIPAVPPVNPSSPTTEGDLSIADISNMSPEEYKSKREEILRGLK